MEILSAAQSVEVGYIVAKGPEALSQILGVLVEQPEGFKVLLTRLLKKALRRKPTFYGYQDWLDAPFTWQAGSFEKLMKDGFLENFVLTEQVIVRIVRLDETYYGLRVEDSGTERRLAAFLGVWQSIAAENVVLRVAPREASMRLANLRVFDFTQLIEAIGEVIHLNESITPSSVVAQMDQARPASIHLSRLEGFSIQLRVSNLLRYGKPRWTFIGSQIASEPLEPNYTETPRIVISIRGYRQEPLWDHERQKKALDIAQRLAKKLHPTDQQP